MEILEAGIEVFSTNGFRNGSIREIAERVGMSQAGLLHHFSNKNELLAGVLELRDDRSRSIVHLDTPPGIATLREMVQLAEFNATVPGLVELHCVLSAEATSADHPAHAYFLRRYEWVVGFLTDAFQQVADDGLLAEGHSAESAARSLTALSDGLQVQWLLTPDRISMAQEMRNFLRLLLKVEV
jgi:AcrR family transcriptional regulator